VLLASRLTFSLALPVPKQNGGEQGPEKGTKPHRGPFCSPPLTSPAEACPPKPTACALTVLLAWVPSSRKGIRGRFRIGGFAGTHRDSFLLRPSGRRTGTQVQRNCGSCPVLPPGDSQAPAEPSPPPGASGFPVAAASGSVALRYLSKSVAQRTFVRKGICGANPAHTSSCLTNQGVSQAMRAAIATRAR
jgi:hypothetical protein